MTKPLFMSPEHVAIMNAKLAAAPEVAQVLAGLESPISLAYELSDGPEGDPVYWSFVLSDTARFGLDALPDADVVMRGDWTSMIQVTMGQQPDSDIVPSGELETQLRLQSLIAALHPYGAVEVEYPVLNDTGA